MFRDFGLWNRSVFCWRALRNTVINRRVPYKAGKFVVSSTTVSLSNGPRSGVHIIPRFIGNTVWLSWIPLRVLQSNDLRPVVFSGFLEGHPSECLFRSGSFSFGSAARRKGEGMSR